MIVDRVGHGGRCLKSSSIAESFSAPTDRRRVNRSPLTKLTVLLGKIFNY